MNSNKLLHALKNNLKGDVRADFMSQQIYSVDASILERAPQAIVLPKDREDLITTVEIARQFKISITARGGGTGIAGGCLGSGIILDLSKYMNRILDCNFKEGWVRCEPGVIQDQLNAYLAPYGYRLGADTSTGNRATLGGMAATNAAGAHSLRYGSMIDHVLGVELITSYSQVIELTENTSFLPLESIPLPEHLPTFKRSSTGYPLYTLRETPRNLAKLTVGSEGTLGIFSELKLKLSPQISQPVLIAIPFGSLAESLKETTHLLSFRPLSLEVMDHHVIEMGRIHPSLKSKLHWLKENPKALLLIEFEKGNIPQLSHNQITFTDPKEQAEVWALRKAGLGLLLSRRSFSRAIAFIEDLAVPPQHLVTFVADLKECVGREMGIYGHAGAGCLHIRPYVDLRDPHEIDWMLETMQKVSKLVQRYEGVLSSEHGNGSIRSWLHSQFFLPEVYAAMVAVKQAFDPLNLMNPGKIVEAPSPKDLIKRSHPYEVATFLNFEKEGGLYLAADLCNGNGECRKQTNLMCPSFQAFGDEKHSTRARAQAVLSALNGKVPFEDEGVLGILDDCLECKGCKTECPSQVDMAKMKMELLFKFQEKKGYSLLNRLFGHLPTLGKWGSTLPSVANGVLNHPVSKKLLSLMGITEERPLPAYASQPLSSWWKERKKVLHGIKKIALFSDTFSEFYSPEVGIAAVELLEKLGYEVTLLPHTCCGRTFLSKGMLKQAKERALILAQLLEAQKMPILILEPSCLSALQDDYEGLIGRKIENLFPIEAFLPKWSSLKQKAFLHPHCHDQALKRKETLLAPFPKDHVVISEAGCCGLAGSFGYEQRHYSMSMAIAEKRLFPQIRQASDLSILSSGFSCRQQIKHGLGIEPLHPAQFFLNEISNL